jgi:integrase/recombinase XerD
MYIEDFTEYKNFVRGKDGAQLRNNKSYLKQFCEWTKINPKRLIDEAEADAKKPVRGVNKAQERLENFFTYLTTEYKKSKRNKHSGKPMKGQTARQMVYCLKKFYGRNGVHIEELDIANVGGSKENKRIEHSPQDIRKMIEAASSKRDKTLISFGYQGGFDAKTVTLLDLGDFPDQCINRLLKNEVPETPVLLHLVREKEGVDFHTCLGFDSINFFRAYLNERKQRGEKLNLNSPAFVLDRTRENNSNGRMKEHLLHHMMRTVAVKSGVVSQERLDRADFNIAGYHSLRATFSKRLEYAGMSPAYIDYMQGHKLPHNGAYRTPNPKKLLDTYREFEHILSVTEAPKTLSEMTDDLRRELEQRDYIIKGMEDRLAQMEEDFKTLKEALKWSKMFTKKAV